MVTLLEDARYINLLSFKRDGGEAKTPVWMTEVDGKLGVFTGGDSYKIKRIRRNPSVRVARCDARGNLLGPWYDGTAAIVAEPERQRRILQALSRKYGWQMALTNFFAAVSGRTKRRAYLEITLKDA
jgi:PPOX class probable F420-dependent enzyme